MKQKTAIDVALPHIRDHMRFIKSDLRIVRFRLRSIKNILKKAERLETQDEA